MIITQEKPRITHGYLEKRCVCYLNDDATLEQRGLLDLLPEEGITSTELCGHDCVPPEDRFWVLAHQDFIPKKKLELLTIAIAGTVIGLLGEGEPDAAACLNAAERYVRGGDIPLSQIRSAQTKVRRFCKAELCKFWKKAQSSARIYVWYSIEGAVSLPSSYVYAAAYYAARANFIAEGTKRSIRSSWLRYLELLRKELEPQNAVPRSLTC